MKILAPSILSADFSALGKAAADADDTGFIQQALAYII